MRSGTGPPLSSPSASTQALPWGSVIVSFSSWLIVDSVGSAVLAFGRGLSDWQCGTIALYGITAYRIPVRRRPSDSRSSRRAAPERAARRPGARAAAEAVGHDHEVDVAARVGRSLAATTCSISVWSCASVRHTLHPGPVRPGSVQPLGGSGSVSSMRAGERRVVRRRSVRVAVLPGQAEHVGRLVAVGGDVGEERVDQRLVAGIERQPRAGRLPEDRVRAVGVQHGAAAVAEGRSRECGDARGVGGGLRGGGGGSVGDDAADALRLRGGRQRRVARSDDGRGDDERRDDARERLTSPPASRGRSRPRRPAADPSRTLPPSARWRCA